jgi:hypothetical protein
MPRREETSVAEERPSGNHVQVNFKERAIGLTTTHLPLVMAIIILGVCVYLLIVRIPQSLDGIRAELRDQNTLLHAQTTQLINDSKAQSDAFRATATQMEERLRAWMLQLWGGLSRINQNLPEVEPGKKLPLELTPPPPAR